jgi:hypothetical protein
MTSGNNYRGRGLVGAAATAALLWATASAASEPDLWSSIEGQSVVHCGGHVTFLIRYGDLGPDVAASPYVNVAIPSGFPAPVNQLTQQQVDELEASAAGTDTLGNTPMLFLEDSGCEHLFFQLQGPRPPQPVQGLGPGKSGAFSFDLPIPMEPPVTASLAITEPPHLAGVLLPALTHHRLYFNDGVFRRYGRGLSCNTIAAQCSWLGDCFGARLSLMEPLSTELALVDDGEPDNPSLGCGQLTDFPVGRVAVARRGGCIFYDKARNAQAAGAAGLVIVNDGQCAGLGPNSPDCVINMEGGELARFIDIPVLMLSVNDGEPIIAELSGGGTVRATLGATQGVPFELSSFAFLSDPGEVDPNPANSGDVLVIDTGLFADGFECGGMGVWSVVGR